MSVTIVNTPYDVKSGTISIRPYIDKTIDNQGLQNYGMVVHEGAFHEEPIALIERNGVRRYVTGLNEFAPEIKLIQDEEIRNAKIKDIRTTIAQLEKELATNVIKDIEGPDFWNQVTLLAPNNDEFWSQITIRCGNKDIPLDPAKDPYDLIKVRAIEAGGFSTIAPSYEAARAMSKAPKFYLDKYEDTIVTKTEVKKLKNKAISELTTLFNKNMNKLFYIAKVIDGNSVQYKKNTPNDVIYDNLDKYINGEGIEQSTKRASQIFLDTAGLDMETLKLRAIIKDSTFFKFIALKADGFIYHVDSSVMLGRNPTECLEFLKNPLHEATLADLIKKTEKYWNQ